MATAERLAAIARRRGGRELLVNACPDEMALTPAERAQAARRLQWLHQENLQARCWPQTVIV